MLASRIPHTTTTGTNVVICKTKKNEMYINKTSNQYRRNLDKNNIWICDKSTTLHGTLLPLEIQRHETNWLSRIHFRDFNVRDKKIFIPFSLINNLGVGTFLLHLNNYREVSKWIHLVLFSLATFSCVSCSSIISHICTWYA